MESVQRAARAKEIALAVVSAAVLAAVGATFVRAASTYPLNVDASFWIPHARMVAAGRVPNVDFVVQYPPGPFYLLALLGEEGLRSPTLVKASLYATQAAGAGLVSMILRRLGSSRATSAAFASVYLAWIATCDGLAVVVEPYVTLFVLAAFLAALRPGGAARVAAAGALAGAAVLCKQYGVLFVPAIGWAAVAGESSAADVSPRGGRWRRAALFAAGVPLPFLTYAFATGQNPVTAFVQFATYGGVSYPASGLRSMLGTLAVGRAARPLVPALAAGLWLLWRHRSPRTIALFLGLAFACAPLYVRTYDHYVQLAAPWAALVVAEFARVAVPSPVRWSARAAAPALAAAAWAAWCLAPVAGELRAAHRRMDRHGIDEQLRIARRVTESLESPHDVLVLNVEWIYAVSDVTQPLPNRDLRFREGLDRLLEMRDAAHEAVLGPGAVPLDEAIAWLAAGGFGAPRLVDAGASIVVFSRVPR